MAQTPEEIAARAAVDAERTAYWQRAAGQHRSHIETAKLVSTVALALAGTLAATGLQVDPRTNLEVTSCILVGLALLAVIALILIDSLDEPDVDGIITNNVGQTDAVTFRDLQLAQRHCLKSNAKTVKLVRALSLLSIACSVISSSVAIFSLLGK